MAEIYSDISREVKISLVLGEKNDLIEEFNKLFYNLKSIKAKVLEPSGLEFIYYNSNNKWLIYYNAKKGEINCHWYNYWDIFEKKFNLNPNQIITFTKLMLEMNLKIKVNNVFVYNHMSGHIVDNALKSKLNLAYIK